MAVGLSKQSHVTEKAQEAAYLVSEVIAEESKSHTLGRNIIIPA
jgi:hypothetical protein